MLFRSNSQVALVDLEDMRDNDREAYEKFFENFGRGLKYGIYSSYGMKADELE